jgi:hypothetical protein
MMSRLRSGGSRRLSRDRGTTTHLVGAIAGYNQSRADMLDFIGAQEYVTASVVTASEGTREMLVKATPMNIIFVDTHQYVLERLVFVQRLAIDVRPRVSALPSFFTRDRAQPAVFIGVFEVILIT